MISRVARLAAKSVAVTGLRGIPGVMGGVETHCEELLPRIHRLDPTISITVFGRTPYLRHDEQWYEGVRIVPLYAPRRQSLEAIVSTLVCVLEARRRGIQLIHIHAIGPALLTPIARLLGLKVLVTHHGADYVRAKWGFVARIMLRAGEWAAMRFAHSVICVGPSLTNALRDRYPHAGDRLFYVPNGAPALGGLPSEGSTEEELLKRLGLTSQSYVLAVGRLVPEKGFEYLIDAYQRAGIAQQLIIVGEADHETAASRRVLARADETVRFLGRQGRATLRVLYKHAALFVLPSLHEGLPIVALEAAECDAPMLLSDIEPNRNIGLAPDNYFPAGDGEALAVALRKPFEQYRVDSADVRRRFNWDEIAGQTVVIYQQLLGQ